MIEVTELRRLGCQRVYAPPAVFANACRDAADEIARLQAERDQFERYAGRLRLAAYEATTNGRWTEGEQCGEWTISAEVYETLRDAIADEQSQEPTP